MLDLTERTIQKRQVVRIHLKINLWQLGLVGSEKHESDATDCYREDGRPP